MKIVTCCSLAAAESVVRQYEQETATHFFVQKQEKGFKDFGK